MFVGTHQRSLDEKGRLALPSQYRDAMGTVCYATPLFDSPTLAIWSSEEFQKAVARLTERVSEGRASQKMQRRFMYASVELRIDGQGRITLPQDLRDRYGISNEAIVAGSTNRLEVWNPEAFDEFHQEDDDIVDDGSWLA